MKMLIIVFISVCLAVPAAGSKARQEKLKSPGELSGHVFRMQQIKQLLGAAEQGKVAAAKKLLKAGANVNAQQINMWTPLMFACSNNHEAMVSLLLSHHARVNTPNGVYSPMILAASNDNLPIMRLLVEHGANVHELDQNGSSLLFFAVDNGYVPTATMLRVVKYLVAKGVQVDIEHDQTSALSILTYSHKIQPRRDSVAQYLRQAEQEQAQSRSHTK